jgi:hypothetical protein
MLFRSIISAFCPQKGLVNPTWVNHPFNKKKFKKKKKLHPRFSFVWVSLSLLPPPPKSPARLSLSISPTPPTHHPTTVCHHQLLPPATPSSGYETPPATTVYSWSANPNPTSPFLPNDQPPQFSVPATTKKQSPITALYL